MDKRFRNEIGSDFELSAPTVAKGLTLYEWIIQTKNNDYQFTFSGRQALGMILDDILLEKKIKTAYLPSYSCLSMVHPFIIRGIKVQFYQVDYIEDEFSVNINFNQNCDIFLVIQYFGFSHNQAEYEQTINRFRSKNVTIIQDITHNMLNDNRMDFNADYYFASLRKWFALASGSVAYKKKGQFKQINNINSNGAVKEKLNAMRMKSDYLNGNLNSKVEYLKKFSDFESSLFRIDIDYTMDSYSLNYLKHTSIESIRDKRRKNAHYLLQNISKSNEIKLLFDSFDQERETPIFVPIVVKNDKRDEFRQYLIENQVFLPIHWPEKLGEHNLIKEIELSIICDQRYSIKDMERVIALINRWISNHKSL